MRPTASAWEAQCVNETRKRCKQIASGIRGLEWLGMTIQDAEQQLSLAVVGACRQWAVENRGKPPSAYLNCAIRRKKLRLWTDIKKSAERGGGWKASNLSEDRMIGVLRTVESGDSPEDAVYEIERQSGAQFWEALLKHRFSPAEYALLRMRADGWTSSEIGELTGLHHESGEVHRVVRQRYWAIKKKAADFLRSVGIETVEDALSATLREKDAAWEKAWRKWGKSE